MATAAYVDDEPDFGGGESVLRRPGGTVRSRQVIAQIVNHFRRCELEGDLPPTVRELGMVLGLRSSSTVQNHLLVAEQRGLVRRLGPAGSSRAWRLVPDPNAKPCPTCGRPR
jgi:SOS-response transcriptional repressor LexA